MLAVNEPMAVPMAVSVPVPVSTSRPSSGRISAKRATATATTKMPRQTPPPSPRRGVNGSMDGRPADGHSSDGQTANKQIQTTDGQTADRQTASQRTTNPTDPHKPTLDMTPAEALEMLIQTVEMLLYNHGDVPPSPHDPTATTTNMRAMEAEKVQIIRSNSERDLARMRAAAERTEAKPKAEEAATEAEAKPKAEEAATEAEAKPKAEADADTDADAQAEAQKTPSQHNAITRRFYSKHSSPISARSYLQRLHKYCALSTAVYLWVSSAVFRLARTEQTMSLSGRNVHRLLLAALDVASKALEDHSWPHARMAQVGGVKPGELTRLEVSFCFLCNFDLQTTTDGLERGVAEVRAALEEARKEQTNGGREQPDKGRGETT